MASASHDQLLLSLHHYKYLIVLHVHVFGELVVQYTLYALQEYYRIFTNKTEQRK